jgi:teichuronic acid biosynthesis glycosyltransferase TuaC
MRIAVVSTSYPQSDGDPSGHFVRAEVNELVQQGHHVTVICPGDKGCSEPNSNPAIVRLGATELFGWPGALSRLRANPMVICQLLPFVWATREALGKGPFERVIAHWLVPSGWPISNASPCPTEVVIHGSDARLVARLPVWLRDSILLSLQANGHRLRFVAAHLKSLIATPKTQACRRLRYPTT